MLDFSNTRIEKTCKNCIKRITCDILEDIKKLDAKTDFITEESYFLSALGNSCRYYKYGRECE